SPAPKLAPANEPSMDQRTLEDTELLLPRILAQTRRRVRSPVIADLQRPVRDTAATLAKKWAVTRRTSAFSVNWPGRRRPVPAHPGRSNAASRRRHATARRAPRRPAPRPN